MGMDHRARWRVPLAALAVGLLVALGPASTSVAEPVNPSDQEVQRASGAVAAGVSAVADIEVQLAQQSTARDLAYVAAAAAGESYLRADQERQEAAVAATSAAVLLESANAEMEVSRRTLVAIALQASRSGGTMDGVAAFLSADGFDDVVERSTVLSRIGVKADRAVQQLRADTLVADALSERADDAVAERTRTAADAQAALAAATQAQVDADTAIAAAQVQRDLLIDQLAVARSTTAEIERARQDQLDADRDARVNAAAQAARTAPASSAATATVPATTAPGPTQPAAAPAPTTPGPTTPAPTPAPAAPAPAAPAPVVVPDATPTPTPTPAPTGSSRGSAGQGAAAVAWAKTQLGLEYVWGATGPDAYDCSGLTSKAWAAAGLNINRTSRDQYKAALKISYDELRPGDLIFWGTNPDDVSSIHHVAMWAGNGQIVEAARPGVLSRVTSMDYRWAGTMRYAGRP